jgi:hypothetical protein
VAKNLGAVLGGIAITRDIDLGHGDTFEATFDPTSLPSDNDGVYEANDIDEIAGIICTVIKSWDLVGPVPFSDIGKLKSGELVADGDPIPLDPTILVKLPPVFIASVLRGLVTASFPKAETRMPANSETPNE